MSVTVRILGDDSDLQKTLGDSTKQLAKYGAAAAAAGAAAAAALTVQGLKAVDAQAKLARSLDTSIDSLRALQIAASDSGLDDLEASMNRLNRRLGAAEMGMGEAGKSVEALNLNLAELSDMDADERVAAIADAVRDSGVSMQQAARHAQNLGFEQAEAAAFFRQGGDAIRSYRKEVEDLGLSLSGIDAAKVEMANDAFSRLGLLTEGLQQQLAVESAPYLKAISEEITEVVKKMGGLGQVSENTFDFIIKAVGFVGDAMRGFEVIIKALETAYKGWGVAATTVVNTVVQALDAAINGAKESINDLIVGFNNLPGVDISELVIGQSDFAAGMQGLADTAKAAFDESVSEMHQLLMQPLPSESIEKWAEGVKAKAEEAAKAMVDAQGGSSDDNGEEGPGGIGMTDEEKGKLQDRLDKIRQANMTEVELANQKYEMENEALNNALEQELITKQEWFELSKEQKARQEEELTGIEKRASDARKDLAEAEARAKKQAMGDALSQVSSLMNSESKEMFKIGKAAALSQAIIDGKAAIVGAYKVGASIGGPALGAAYGAAAGLATMQNINAIRSQSFGGGGGGGSGGSATQNVNAQTQPVQSQNLNVSLQGFDPNSLYTGQQVGGLLDALSEEAGDRGLNLMVQR